MTGPESRESGRGCDSRAQRARTGSDTSDRDLSVQQEARVDRPEVTRQIIEAMREKGVTFGEVAKELDLDKTWTTAALLGQHRFTAERAERVQRLFDLPDEAVAVLQEVPTRGSLASVPPADPTMYRIYEVLQVYGTTIKALIHEEFGDGIMSAINFRLSVDRDDTEQGPRVKITLDGAFLPYRDPASW